MTGKRTIFEANHNIHNASLGKITLWALLCAALLTGLMYSGLFDDLNRDASDRMYQRERALEGNIFVLGIDEKALEHLGPFQTWTRDTVAQVIETLNVSDDCHPAVIGVDVMYFGESEAASDRHLVAAAEKYGNVVTASNVVFESELVEDENGFYMDGNAVRQIELPFDALSKVAVAGHLNSFPDKDGVIRHALQYIDLPEDIAAASSMDRSESFALQIYKKYAEAMGLPMEMNMPLGERGEWYIPYSAAPGGYGDGFSLWDVLSGELPPEMFADAVVLIGPYTTGLMDSFQTPVDKVDAMYGVEIHANIVDAMLQNDYRQPVSGTLQTAILFVLLFLLFYPLYFLSIALSTPLVLAVSGGYLLLARQMVFPLKDSWFVAENGTGTLRYMLDPLYIPLAVFLLYIGILAVNFFTSQKEKRQVTNTFKKYVDPAIIDDIFEKGLDDLHLGGRRTDICVMFVDIRGFTPMSEVMAPEEVVSMLGEYLQLTSSAIFEYKGTLDKFIGDATMAFFNAPLSLDDYVYRAVLTAWKIVQGGKELETGLYEKYGRSVSFGIGLHCGEAVVGNIGTPHRVDYTAIGNTVNTAARLESNAKKGQVLLSQEVYDAVADRVEVNLMGNIPLKGKSEEITVYELVDIKEKGGSPS